MLAKQKKEIIKVLFDRIPSLEAVHFRPYRSKHSKIYLKKNGKTTFVFSAESPSDYRGVMNLVCDAKKALRKMAM